MRGKIGVAILAGAVGFVLGNAFWYLASPLWIDTVVNEQLSAASTSGPILTGTFRDADAFHNGSGDVAVIETADGLTVRLTNFEVTNGPDLKVWLVAHSDPANRGDVLDNEWLALGPLKGNVGDQNYQVPAGTDLSKYQSVVIWCEQFSVLFSTAALQ